MPRITFSTELDEIGDEVRDVLPVGETLVAVSSVTPAFGSTGRHDPDFSRSKAAGRLRGVGEAVDRASAKARLPRWLARAAVVVGGIGGIGPSWSAPGRLVRRLLGGEVVTGPSGCTARELQAELPPYGLGRYLAVTDRRMVVLNAAPLLSRRSVSTEPPEWSAPLTVVAQARHRPRFLARARLELTFADGSRVILSGYPPHFGGRHARTVAAVLR